MKEGKRGDLMLMGRVVAGTALIGRTGATEFELAYDDDIEPVQWWAGANWGGTRMFSERFPYPAQAVEDLLSRVVNGGKCKRCGNTTVVGIVAPGFCSMTVHATDLDDTNSYRYERNCGRGQQPTGSERSDNDA